MEQLLAKLDNLQEDASRIHYRLLFSETLHRNVGYDADIYHYDRIAPQVILYSALGALVAVFIFKKNK